MIRVSHITLPAGLSALARRGADGELTVYVSDTLDPARQRAAVRAALRAARREGWRTLVPVPTAALLMAAGLNWLRRAARALRAHPLAWGTASAVVAATSAAVYLAVLPHSHRPAATARPPAPAVSQPPASGRPAAPAHAHPRRSHRAHAHPVASPPAAAPPGAAGSPASVTVQAAPAPGTQSSTPGTQSSAPAPPPSPSPAPSTSPPPKGSHCIRLLGVRVCLGLGL